MSHVEYHEHHGHRYMHLTTGLTEPTLILDVTTTDRRPDSEYWSAALKESHGRALRHLEDETVRGDSSS